MSTFLSQWQFTWLCICLHSLCNISFFFLWYYDAHLFWCDFPGMTIIKNERETYRMRETEGEREREKINRNEYACLRWEMHIIDLFDRMNELWPLFIRTSLSYNTQTILRNGMVKRLKSMIWNRIVFKKRADSNG